MKCDAAVGIGPVSGADDVARRYKGSSMTFCKAPGLSKFMARISLVSEQRNEA